MYYIIVFVFAFFIGVAYAISKIKKSLKLKQQYIEYSQSLMISELNSMAKILEYEDVQEYWQNVNGDEYNSNMTNYINSGTDMSSSLDDFGRMGKIFNWLTGAFAGVLGIIYLLLNLGALALHLWTILIAFQVKGFIAALITFIFPIVSQIYWIFYSRGISGVWITQYNLVVFSFVAAYIIVVLVSSFVINKIEKSQEVSE